MTITGYKYNTEQEAIEARKQAADYYGLPVSPDTITQYFVDYNYTEIDQFWYIVWYEGCNETLGEPTEFEITQPEIGLN